MATAVGSELTPGAVYSWSELGAMFDFEPGYLSVAGGMLPRPRLNALLLITHPGGARSFDYKDYRDGDALIYTGRGKFRQRHPKASRATGASGRSIPNERRLPTVL